MAVAALPTQHQTAGRLRLKCPRATLQFSQTASTECCTVVPKTRAPQKRQTNIQRARPGLNLTCCAPSQQLTQRPRLRQLRRLRRAFAPAADDDDAGRTAAVPTVAAAAGLLLLPAGAGVIVSGSTASSSSSSSCTLPAAAAATAACMASPSAGASASSSSSCRSAPAADRTASVWVTPSNPVLPKGTRW